MMTTSILEQPFDDRVAYGSESSSFVSTYN